MGALCSLTAAFVNDVQAEEDVGIHLLDVFPDALFAVTGVYQIQGGTDQVGGIERIDDFRGHHADHGGDIAFFHAQCAQTGSGLFDVDDEVCIGDLPAVVLQRGSTQMLLVLLADKVKGRAVRQSLVDELGVIGLQPGACLRCIKNI